MNPTQNPQHADTRTELEKDAPLLLFALHDAWPYVHGHCTIEPRRKSIAALMRKHGDFADVTGPHAAYVSPADTMLRRFVQLFDEVGAMTDAQMREAGINAVSLHGDNGSFMFRAKQVADAARSLFASSAPPNAAFSICVDGEEYAGTYGPRDQAYEEAMRYAGVYQDGGAVSVDEVVCIPALRLSGIPRTPVNPEECYHLQSRVYRRPETAEWVLEIEGTIGTCHVTSRHTQPITVAAEDVPGLPSRYEPLSDDEISAIAEEFAFNDFENDYPATIHDIVREVERRLQEQ